MFLNTNSKSLPKVTLNVAVRNEEKRIGTLLDSVANQNYPKELIDVVIVDGMSTDRTLEVVNGYQDRLAGGIRIIKNEMRDSATGRTLGLLNASGAFHMYLDADMELAEPDTLQKLIAPLLGNSGVIGSLTRILPNPRDPPLNNFLAHNPFQQDPLFEFLSKDVEDTVSAHAGGYDVCTFRPGSVPLIGVIVFPTELLREIYREMKTMWPNWMWADIDFPIAFVSRGYTKYAYVRNTGIYHHSFANLPTFLRKKRRDVTWSYLTTVKYRYATYVNADSKKDVLFLAAFVLYSESFILPFVRGLGKALRFRDPYCAFYEPILSWALTNYIISLMVLDPRGRRFVAKLAWTLLFA